MPFHRRASDRVLYV